MNVLKSFIDTYETIDGQTIQSLSTSEREAYEKDPYHGARDPRLNVSVFVPGDNPGLSNYHLVLSIRIVVIILAGTMVFAAVIW